MQVRKYDPKEGQAFQGDIAIIPMPSTIAIATSYEIKPRDGRLIIQEGEVSGHHHAIICRREEKWYARITDDPTTH